MGWHQRASAHVYQTQDKFVGFFIGYYKSQRQGDSMHSPLNCLPGAGWQPIAKSYLPIQVTDAAGRQSEIVVNRYLIEKGLEQQVVSPGIIAIGGSSRTNMAARSSWCTTRRD